MIDKDKMNSSEAIAAVAAALCAAAVAAWFAFSVVGPTMNMPSVKSERELCRERGGVYGALRGDQYRCFAKETFK